MKTKEQDVLNDLFSNTVKGPFVSFSLNTLVAHQDITQDIITFKNFAKAAKERFEKKYPKLEWAPFQEQIDELIMDGSFWRDPTASVTIIFTQNNSFIQRQVIHVQEQYYVDSKPYLLGIIKNIQFNHEYYLLALNRDSMALYHVENQNVTPISLPDDAPVNVNVALGDQLTGGEVNYSTHGGPGYNNSSKEGVSYHSVNTKDQEVEIDWQNYYQAVDTFLQNSLKTLEKLPIRLFALKENQVQFIKIAKNSYLDQSASITASPAQATMAEIKESVKTLNQTLERLKLEQYNKLLDKKYLDQLEEIVPAIKEGKVAYFFISTANLVATTTKMTSEEFDRNKLFNDLVYSVIEMDGKVYILDQSITPDEKSLIAVLRY